MYHLLPKASVAPISRRLSSQRSWPKDKRDIPLGHEKWLWRLDNMNCSELPFNSDVLKLQINHDIHANWEYKELQKYVIFCYSSLIDCLLKCIIQFINQIKLKQISLEIFHEFLEVYLPNCNSIQNEKLLKILKATCFLKAKLPNIKVCVCFLQLF